MSLLFNCANIICALEGDLPEAITQDIVQFFSDYFVFNSPIFKCHFEKVDELDSIEGNILFQDSFRIILNKNGHEKRIFLWNAYRDPYACCEEIEKNIFKIQYMKQLFPSINMRFLELFPLEKILLQTQGYVLHACFIKYNNEAIVFTAPSGTGKSTQGKLWVDVEGAEIINGDRCIIRNIHNQYYACGLPFCGSSHINKNENVPLKAIVIVKQSPVDEIILLEKSVAIKKIMSETSINFWNPVYIKEIVAIIENSANNVTIVQLNCTKTPNAVNILKTYLQFR